MGQAFSPANRIYQMTGLPDGLESIKLKNKIKKYVLLVRQRRFDFILQAIAWSVPRWLFFYNHAVYIYSDNPTWECQIDDSYQVRLGGAEDVALFEKIGVPESTALARFESGDKVGIVTKNGELATAVWGGGCKRFLKYSGTCFDPGADGVFYYGAYTQSDVRGQGCYSAARKCLYDSFIADGRPRNWGVISANNPKWLAAVLKRNFTLVGETFYVKILFINVCYYRKWFYPRNKVRLFLCAPRHVLSV